jgi:hypothetical protein
MSHRNASSLSIAAVVLLGSVSSHAQSASDRAPTTAARVTAEPATVNNGNPSTLRGVILRSFAAMQRCAANLPLAAPINANLQGSTAAPAFDACARTALAALPWPRVARGATQLRWTYVIELPSAPSAPNSAPTVTVTADMPNTNGNISTLRGVILR